MLQYCNSVKPIKYVCKYVNKGSDAAMFALQQQDEVTQYQQGRYISSNEAFWRSFGFYIHQRHQLAVHLENAQIVYFNEQNATNLALTPNETTLTAFFKLCNSTNLPNHCSILGFRLTIHGTTSSGVGEKGELTWNVILMSSLTVSLVGYSLFTRTNMSAFTRCSYFTK